MSKPSRSTLAARLLCAVTPPALLFAPAIASAQQGGPPPLVPTQEAPPAAEPQSSPTSGPAVQEIVVTAQRRSENLQNVPIAVTALSAQQLANKGVSGTAELTAVVPGLNFVTAGGEAQPRIRGIGTDNTAAGNESSVSTYVDDVYYASAAASIFSFANIQQLSVLKGPQGTLFGRNATGGLIQITTRDPTDQEYGDFALSYGSQETVGADGYFSGGVLPNLAADLAVHFNYMGEGYGVNLYDGTDTNRTRELALRSKWIYRPDADTKVTFLADFSKSFSTSPSIRAAYGETELGGFRYTGGPFDVDSNTDQHYNYRQYGLSVNAQHSFGSVELVSITAYRNDLYYSAQDDDASPNPYLSIFVTEPTKQYSEEIRLQSTGSGRLTWQLGTFIFRYESGFVPATVGGLALGMGPGQQGLEVFSLKQNTSSYAGFGQATYKIDDRTDLTVGVRVTNEQKTVHVPEGASFDTFPLPAASASFVVTKPTWRFALDHHFTSRIMGYVSYDRGYKNGGYDPASTTPKAFSGETLDAYEVGLKTEAFSRRLRLNIASYYYDYKDIQLSDYLAGLLNIFNGSSATVKGVDLDITAIPVSGLTLTGGMSYVDGTYGDFPIAVTALAPGGGLEQLPNESGRGKQLEDSPTWQGSVGANYSFQVGADKVSLDASYAYNGKYYATPDNRLFQPGYSLVNASATWYLGPAQKYSIRVWGKNLGNTVYAEEIAEELPVGDLLSIAPGRSFGITGGVQF